ncbi:hypothetical protein [Mesoterricola silvestris]|uniref:Uncharacterized protein n=1 Tax=Mesoterricola silvestris TaxID=2927979 RepID=A0AA48GII8_9BACT|nr:hypothetical protein [Mesoterricola silvestris]BDU73586.1 hypothetical protein METEAL_27600 [Mesoterricola silvestris]
MESMNEKDLRMAAGDALVDAVKAHLAELQAQGLTAEQIMQAVAETFALDRLGSVGRLVPTGLLNGPDAQ